MDYLSLQAAATEAQLTVKSRKVTDAFQLSSSEAVFVLGKGPALLLSIDPGKGGIFLPEGVEPDRSSSNLTDLLRARIRGAVLQDVEIPQPGERIVHFTFAPGWPDRKGAPILVVLEVMGRHSNLLVLEEGRILAAFKNVPPEKSRVRPVVPGNRYLSPPERSGTPLGELAAHLLPEPGAPDARNELLKTVRGLSPYTVSQALARASGGGKQALCSALEEMGREASGGKGYILRSEGRGWLSPFEPLKGREDDTVELYEPFSRAALAWRGPEPDGGPRAQPAAQTLVSALESMIVHITSSLEHLESERDRCLGFRKTRAMAEILLINASDIVPGSPSATLSDPYGGEEPVTIALDPEISPHENANRLFAAARRLERGLTELESRKNELGDELHRLEMARTALLEHGDPEPARKILGNDRSPGHGRSGLTAERHRGPGRRKVVDGFTILVGKSATDNEKVTFRAAGPNDLWLHARDYPGSHVVILTGRRQVPDKVLYAAASLAAQGSGAKNDTAPEIMVTERKWVRKLKGGKPGQVTVERFKTLRPGTSSPKTKAQSPKGKDKC
ncbi:MAG: NFACT family protein [bacterium]|nr:NFACT family protein [bacterium]MDT8396206.1 NFACT family protein [bacterium]